MADLADTELVALCQRLGVLRAAAPGPQWVAYPVAGAWGLAIHLPRLGGTPQDAAAYLEELLAAEPVLTAALRRLLTERESLRVQLAVMQTLVKSGSVDEVLTLSGTDPRYLEYLRQQREQGPPPGPPQS